MLKMGVCRSMDGSVRLAYVVNKHLCHVDVTLERNSMKKLNVQDLQKHFNKFTNGRSTCIRKIVSEFRNEKNNFRRISRVNSN